MAAAKAKASAASKAVLKGTKFTLKKKKVRTNTTFRRPKTRCLARKPKVRLQSSQGGGGGGGLSPLCYKDRVT